MNDRKPPVSDTMRRAAGDAKSPRLGRDIQNRIGDKLRAMYDDIVEEGVPDRFSSLLQQFDATPSDKQE